MTSSFLIILGALVMVGGVVPAMDGGFASIAAVAFGGAMLISGFVVKVGDQIVEALRKG